MSFSIIKFLTMLCHAVNHGDNSTEMSEPMMKDEKKMQNKTGLLQNTAPG